MALIQAQTTNFGFSTDTTPKAASFRGMSGWFTVPCGWYVWTDSNGQIWCSPNADHSSPCYDCKTDLDGYLKFMDLMKSRIAGQS